VFELTFRGASQCMLSVHVLCFGLFNPSEYCPLHLYFQQLSIHICISSTFTSVVCNIMVFFFFLAFPEFHRVVILLQACSTIDHVWFCVYVYLWIYLPHMRENMHLLCFWSWLTLLNMISSNCIQLPSNPMSLFLAAE
jgi:hypothetical protein